MISIDAAIVCTELAWLWNKTFDTAAVCSPQPRVYVLSTASGDGSSSKKDDLVVTPGGPRPRARVHTVRPGETVRRNADGTFTVVPKDAPVSIEERGGKEKGKEKEEQ